jgi:hypothetical protein
VHDQAFRPSLRDLVPRLALLAVASWVALRLALGLDVRAATVATVGALGVMIALRLARRPPATRVLATDDALVVSGPDGERTIPWPSLERVRLTAGDVTTRRGVVRVSYAHVDVTHGRPVAFADLSPIGSPHLRTVEGDAPVHDVGDPELLLGVIAERLDAREFLPPPDRAPEAERAGPWITASPLATLRLGVVALVAHRLLRPLSDPDAVMAACAGAMSVVAPHALVRFVAQRHQRGTQSEVGAPPAIIAGALSAFAVAFALRAVVPEAVGAWALLAALLCALPSWPFPGAYVARRFGRGLATLDDTVPAALVALLGVIAALLYARGLVLLPTALVAGGLEAAEGVSATRRHARLAALPRFRNWPPLALARMRSALRPSALDAVDPRLVAGDVVELRDASLAPPPAGLAAVVAALLGAVFAALAARAFFAHGAPAARDVLRVFVA